MAEGQLAEPFGAFVTAMDDIFIATLASSFLDRSPQCLAYFGLDRSSRFTNSNFDRIFGFDPAFAGPASLAAIMGQQAADRIEALEARALAGETVTFSLTVSPAATGRTEISGFLIPHADAGGT